MTAFGGSLGAAGGQATYYAGTLAYVAGRFSIWELSIMAVVGSLFAMGKVLYDVANRQMQDMIKATEEGTKRVKELTKATDDLYEAEYNLFFGIDKKKKLLEDAKFEKWYLDQRASNLRETLRKVQQRAWEASDEAGRYMQAQMNEIRKQIRQAPRSSLRE
jgi:hypothetical protein